MKIACVTSDAAHAIFFEQSASLSGHDIRLYGSGRQLMNTAFRDFPDLFLISWALRDHRGSEILRWIRTNLRQSAPVIVVGNASDSGDIVSAFSEGADDFIVFPITTEELLARVNARLRATAPYSYTECLSYGVYKMDLVARVVTRNEVPVTLTAREFDVLEVFFRNLGVIIERKYISRAVWGRELDALSRTVDTHISRVRSKLKFCSASGLKLDAVYGHGYRLGLAREEKQVNSCP